MSHAHGWSAGPTSALTEFVLGLAVTGPVGSTWQFAPQFGDLKKVEGGFMTALGKFQASWSKGEEKYEAAVVTPSDTSGQLILPVTTQGKKPKVVLDGKVACTKWYRRSQAVSDLVVVQTIGGTHSIVVSDA